MTEKKSFFYTISAFIFAICLLLDQWTKYLAVTFLKGQEALVLIPGVLELRYLENQGAAFGMLQNQQWFFIILTIVFLVAALWMLRRIPKTGRFLPLILTIAFLCAGAVGNFIDRIVHRYVVDFIYFSLIDFPIFNVADICVTVSVIALVILLLFRYKEEDLNAVFRKDA